MRVVALFRVSSLVQENHGASLDAQERRFRDLAGTLGWTVIAEFRGQESATKAATERAVLQQVLTCIQDSAVDALWVYEQSRLTRGDELEVALLTRELRERRVQVLVGTQAYDLAEPSSALSFGLQAVVDGYETRRFKERVARGKREKALQGKRTGGAVPYGYFDPPKGGPLHGVLQLHPEAAPVVRRIFAATAAGVTSGRLAVQLTREGIPSPRRGGAWGKTTISRILQNPSYLGQQASSIWIQDPETSTFRRDLNNPRAVVVSDAHQPIVTPDVWEAAHAQRRGSSTGRPGLLTGMLSIDGRAVHIDRSGGKSYYAPATGAGGAWVPVEAVNGLVWQGFVGIVQSQEALTALLRRSRDPRESAPGGSTDDLEATRRRLQGKLDRLLDLVGDGLLSKQEYARKAEQVRRALGELDVAATEARRRAQVLRSGHAERTVAALAALLGGRLSPEQQRRALRTLVGRVDVDLAAGSIQPKGERGRYAARSQPKWTVRTVLLGLHRYPEPDRVR
jgi:DNA invertase Pin-like site-specific DNA recombinase